TALELDANTSSYLLGPHMDVLEDKTGELTFEDVIAPPYRDRFAPLGQEIPNFGISRSAFWFRAIIRNSTNKHDHLVLQQFSCWIDSIDVYLIQDKGKRTSMKAGANYPFARRPIVSPHFLFPLSNNAYEETLLFVRITGDEPLQAPFMLWGQHALSAHIQGLNLYYGLWFGLLLAVFLYDIFMFLLLGNKGHAYIVIYIASLAFMISAHTGYSYQYLWPGSPWLQDRALFLAAYLSMLLGVFFTKVFFNTPQRMPRINRFLSGFQALLLTVAAYGVLNGAHHSANHTSIVIATIFPWIMTFIGVAAYFYKFREARYFILAWVSSVIGIMFTNLALLGHGQADLVSIHSMEVGMALNALLLSFALADKIRIEMVAKDLAEEEVRIVLTESKHDLEAMVEKRTVELTQAKEQAEQATELKDKFVGMVSHDLRAPIGSLINMIKLLKLENPDTPTIAINEEIVTRVLASSERLLRLVDNILNISRLSSGKIGVSRKPTDMWHLANSHILDLEFLAMDKGVTIVNDMPHDFVISVDPDLFGEVLANLLSNAIKFCHKGDTVTFFRPDIQQGVVAVRDTGTGIDYRLLQDIFRIDMRLTTPGTAGEVGTGLGLAYCHEIISAHGGVIRAESKPGDGSVFYVELPAVAE
ncbi:MAG: sensor histidine kinase, partial [Nitrospinota bacterium]|nr:sensor histidine kinase [Nitrospinota bacterium]